MNPSNNDSICSQTQQAHNVETTSIQCQDVESTNVEQTLSQRCVPTGKIVLGFNDTSTLVGHFVSSPREREKRDRRESRIDERERQGRKRNRNESEETEEKKHTKHSPSTLTCYKDNRPFPTKPISVGHPGDVRTAGKTLPLK